MIKINKIHIIGNDSEIPERLWEDNGVFIIDWVDDDSHIPAIPLEWGQLILTYEKDGSITIDGEHISDKRIKEIFMVLINTAKIVG